MLLQDAITLCHAYHCGSIIIDHDDLDSFSIMTELCKSTSDSTYHWRRKASRALKQHSFIYSGRRFDDIALADKGKRAWLLEEMDIDMNNHFDLKAAVPSLHNLLSNNVWSATDPNIHLRKDIAAKLGIVENDNDKTITFRWLFEESMKEALNHWHFFKLNHKDEPFSYTDETFIKGWTMMQQSIYPNRDGLPWTTNKGYPLSHSIFYHESMLEEMITETMISEGFRIANAYDCFYTDSPISTLVEVIDDCAGRYYVRYWNEIDNLNYKGLTLDDYGKGEFRIKKQRSLAVSMFIHGPDPDSSSVMSSGAGPAAILMSSDYLHPVTTGAGLITTHKESITTHKTGRPTGSPQIGGNRNNGVEEQRLRQELAVFCGVSIKTIDRERHAGLSVEQIKSKKRRSKKGQY